MRRARRCARCRSAASRCRTPPASLRASCRASPGGAGRALAFRACRPRCARSSTAAMPLLQDLAPSGVVARREVETPTWDESSLRLLLAALSQEFPPSGSRATRRTSTRGTRGSAYPRRRGTDKQEAEALVEDAAPTSPRLRRRRLDPRPLRRSVHVPSIAPSDRPSVPCSRPGVAAVAGSRASRLPGRRALRHRPAHREARRRAGRADPHRRRAGRRALVGSDDGDDRRRSRTFCEKNFLTDPAELERAFERLEEVLEQVDGHLHEIRRMLTDAARPRHRPGVEPLDRRSATWTWRPTSSDDLFAARRSRSSRCSTSPSTRWPSGSSTGPEWNRETWARSRMMDRFDRARPRRRRASEVTRAFTAADQYIADYNIRDGPAPRRDGRRSSSPEGKSLITHWGLRDELGSPLRRARTGSRSSG